jgi:hypothetical protein
VNIVLVQRLYEQYFVQTFEAETHLINNYICSHRRGGIRTYLHCKDRSVFVI